jgi:sigma-B regulation protein RsbU (phosphoserine phosphatase)
LNVTKSIPSYLRIHCGPKRPAPFTPAITGEDVESFWDAYREATGWRRDRRASAEESSLQLLPAVTLDSMDGADTEPPPPVSHHHAVRLAESAMQLDRQLQQAREMVRRQEIELAARASIIVDDDDRDRIADRIEATLGDAALACGCDAAVMYLLDDDTQYLKARSAFGISPQTLQQPPRELRGSRGDLEALVQGVVTIDDFHVDMIDTWNSPEPFGCGICAAILQDEVPIGTLWLFGNQAREFTARESAAARLAAAQLALLLSQASRGQSGPSRKQEAEVVRDIGLWQYEGLPVGAQLAEGWRVDGMIESPSPWATGWHAWDVLPDGSLLLAMAEACDPTVMGAMTAAIARAALASHAGYRHTPRQLMQRVHDTLWHTSTAQQLVSMLYARVDPETGEGEVASAGNITALIANRYGYRPIVDGNGPPLTSHIDPRCVAETFRMGTGETLIAYGHGVVHDGANQRMIGESVRSSMQQCDVNPLARLRRQLAGKELQNERGLVSLVRMPDVDAS